MAGNIVVVDDEMLIRQAYTDIFEDIGFNVTTFEDGDSLLAVFRQLHPDLIILDVQMPGMDGFSVCREIRKLPAGKHIPIIIISGSCGPNDPMPAQSDADRFIHKPVRTEELVAAVNTLLPPQRK